MTVRYPESSLEPVEAVGPAVAGSVTAAGLVATRGGVDVLAPLSEAAFSGGGADARSFSQMSAAIAATHTAVRSATATRTAVFLRACRAGLTSPAESHWPMSGRAWDSTVSCSDRWTRR